MIKYFFLEYHILIVGTFALQSCSVSTTNHYADKKFSFATDIDMAQALEMMKGLMPDSLNQIRTSLKWKNIREIGKVFTTFKKRMEK
jgi:hypothetical protein